MGTAFITFPIAVAKSLTKATQGFISAPILRGTVHHDGEGTAVLSHGGRTAQLKLLAVYLGEQEAWCGQKLSRPALCLPEVTQLSKLEQGARDQVFTHMSQWGLFSI